MKISSAALTALDLLRYPQASGGIDNVATVLSDLGQRIDPDQLATLSAQVERPIVQRLGHLLEHLGHDALTEADAEGVAGARIAALDGARPAGGSGPGLCARAARARSPVAGHRKARAGARRMIPAQNIVAWGNVVPWADQRQVEQDLIISRALVEMFSDEMLRDGLRLRRGTALNKLHFPAPLRYSEDIDLVRSSAGPIGPILDRLRVALEPWLGRAQFDRSPVAPKFRFRVEAEDGSGVPIRLKVEINTREIEAFDAPAALPLEVVNPLVLR